MQVGAHCLPRSSGRARTLLVQAAKEKKKDKKVASPSSDNGRNGAAATSASVQAATVKQAPGTADSGHSNAPAAPSPERPHHKFDPHKRCAPRWRLPRNPLVRIAVSNPGLAARAARC